jgi:site-specific recombinase XerD
LWEDAVLLSHGHTPTRKRGKLTAASQAAFQAIGLHLHDIRREFACQLLESGAALHDVKTFLGHADIGTTSRYLQSAPMRLEQALSRMETLFAHDSHKQDSEASSEASKTVVETASNSLN